jgi:exodeoxyribonuclease V alpha subunit
MITSPKQSPALLALIEKVRARNSAAASIPTESTESIPTEQKSVTHSTNQYGIDITYNTEQQAFIDLALCGEHCVLIGAAGTGKTTCQKGAVLSLLQSNRIPVISDNLGHKYIKEDTPGIILTSFTRRAVRNIKRAMSDDMKDNCITLHKLLEYQPVPYDVYDEKTDSYKQSMRFEPTRNSVNPLPSTIKAIVFDEASMISTDLYQQLCSALHHDVQFIFVGDIQQLPPVFGSAVLGFKLLEYPVIELTQVYRQALESPIIALATQIRNGEHLAPFTEKVIQEHPTQGKLTLHPWKKKLHPEVACLTAAKFFTAAYTQNLYDPYEDQILIPFNKAFGTLEINKHIANHIAKTHSRDVWEIIAGFNKYYFSVGDLCLYDKEDAEIVSINRNGTYLGKKPQKESVTLDYWGFNSAGSSHDPDDFDLESIDNFLAAAASSSDEEKVNSSSHIIKLRMLDTDETVVLDTASEVNSLLLSYALTVHKAQGSEWERVFVLFHQSHNTMIQRELLYTAITRAKKELYVICEPDTFERGVKSQKIKGTTLAEKAEYFKGKLESQ